MVGHLTIYLLDRYASELLGGEERRQAEEHASQCASCAERLRVVLAARSTFLAQHPPEQVVNRLLAEGAPRRARWLWPWLTAPLAATAIALWVTWAALPGPRDERPAVLGKGGVELYVAAHRPRSGASWAPRSGEPLRAGDVLRVTLATGALPHAAVYACASDGKATAIYRSSSPGPQALPEALVLDDDLESMLLLAVFSERVVPDEDVQRALAVALGAAHGDLNRVTEFPTLEGAGSVRTFLIAKAP